MYWETLLNWVWIIYYTFILATLGASILSIIRKKNIILSIISAVLTITIPIISIINSIGREKGVDEFEHLIAHLQQGSPWSIYAVTGFFYLVVWWAIFLIKRKRRKSLIEFAEGGAVQVLHHMGIYDEYFISIKEGKKTIEVRLNDDKRRKIKVGDTVEFIRIPEKMKHLGCK